MTNDTIDLRDLSPDQVLAAFLDACHDRNQEAATDAIHELRYRVWSECELPRDVRPDPKEQAELRRFSALWRARHDGKAA
jgi:hypothetical protein